MTVGDEQWNWSWDYLKEDSSSSKLYWKSWRGAPVWRSMPLKKWLDMLDSTAEAVGEEGRSLGYKSDAQSSGFTASHPLDSIFIPPVVVYRNDDDLRDWLEQTEAQEVRRVREAQQVLAAQNEGEKRHLLNIYFVQTRKACEYPSTCQFVKICFGGEDIRRSPLESGLFKRREPNHPQEKNLGTSPAISLDTSSQEV